MEGAARMAEYWVYENWVMKQATTHYGSCAHCQRRNGQQGATGKKDGRWHGPLPSIGAAEATAQQTGWFVRRCGICKPT